ncbi:MAG TPA: signal peptidase I [Dehalococcoidia bacterium]|nr:signal peptidase I [Dehalococcoidia bacterium]
MAKERTLTRYGLRALDWGSSAALVLVLCAVVAVMLTPHLLGWRYGILRSGSMSPDMPAGAAIVVAPVRMSDVRPGDVITFRSVMNKDLLITHRVVEVTEYDGRPAYRTKGDANEEPDAAIVTPNRIVGRVVFALPYVGHVVQQLRTTTGFILLMVLPTLLIVAIELRELGLGLSEMLRERRKPSPPRNGTGRGPLFLLTLIPLGLLAIKARSLLKSKSKTRSGIGSAA